MKILLTLTLLLITLNLTGQVFGKEYFIKESQTYEGENLVNDFAKSITLDEKKVLVTCGSYSQHTHIYVLEQKWQVQGALHFSLGMENLIYYETMGNECTVTIITEMGGLEFKQILIFDL